MKTKVFVFAMALFTVIALQLWAIFRAKFSNVSPTGSGKGHTVAPQLRNLEHCYSGHASDLQLSEPGSLPRNEQPRFCRTLHQYTIR